MYARRFLPLRSLPTAENQFTALLIASLIFRWEKISTL
jgi:hypothetical protein